MERITLNDNGEIKEVSVVRYIENSGNKYLIYTLGEIEGELQRIYITKVMDNLTGVKVPDEEWNDVKALIQEIVKANRANAPVTVPDLDEKSVNNINVADKRIIKLKTENIPTLEANKNFVVETAAPINVEPPVIPEIEVNPVVTPEPVVEATVEAPAEPVVPVATEPVIEPAPVVETVEPVVEPVKEEPQVAETEPVPTEPVAEVHVEPVVEAVPVEVPAEPTEDYKAKYEEELAKNNELASELESIKAKLEKIIEITKEQ